LLRTTLVCPFHSVAGRLGHEGELPHRTP
jgi:hypothetical protein